MINMCPARLAIDVHGGDFGAETLIKGVISALDERREPFIVHLCGDKNIINHTLNSLKFSEKIEDNRLIIEHCPQSMSSRDIPSRVWKSKSDSSIVRCISLQKEGKVNGSLSAGDTRILMGASIFILGRLKNVTRPALAAFIPTTSHRPSLLIDVGANLNCRTDHLVAFGKMGYQYVKNLFSIENPSVALLNIGKEPSKGTRTIVDAGNVLTDECGGYGGFIEGGRVLAGDADVIVCDGFAGNVLLKACESFYCLSMAVLGKNRELISIMKKQIAILNPENYGAAPLLGIKGTVFKAHGSSSSRAIANAILMAIKAIEQNVSSLLNC